MLLGANAEQLRSAGPMLRAAARRLRAISLETRIDVIAEAARVLADGGSALGLTLRAELRQSSGLSAPVIEHGLITTLALFEARALRDLHASHRSHVEPSVAELVVAVLAGNVFSASARPLLLPLSCGSAVLAKASSADDVFARYIARALAAVDSRFGEACAVVTFGHDRATLEQALLHDADVVSVYGSDDTISALAARVPKAARLLAHGHGLGAIWLAADALTSESAARELAASAALDIAAYDQRGCLSPQVVFVAAGAAGCDARSFARLLAAELERIENALPRGVLPLDAAAAQLQWRGVAAALFELHAGSTWAVSYEGTASLRTSPGYRNISVYDGSDSSSVRAQLEVFGPQLKALGVGNDRARRELAALAPYVCALGAMQTPPLHTELDRLHPLAAL